MFNHDPPIFCIGFAGGFDNAKDSLRNLMDTKECMYHSTHFASILSPASLLPTAIEGDEDYVYRGKKTSARPKP